MTDATLKKYKTLDHHSRKMLGRVIDKINLESFNLKDNPIYQQGMQFLQDMMNPDSEQMKTMEQPYRRQFAEDTAPGIANQFAGSDALSSSGFEHSMGRASSDLEGNIAGMKQNAMMNASNQAMSYAGAPAQFQQNLVDLGLNGPQDYGYQMIPGSKGMIPGVMNAAGQVGGQYAAQRFGNYRNQSNQPSTTQSQYDAPQNNLGGY